MYVTPVNDLKTDSKNEVSSVLFSFNGSPNDNIFVLHGFFLLTRFLLIVIFYKIKLDENDI